MSAEFAVTLFLLCIGSCYACFRLGQENVLHQFREYCDKQDSSQDETTNK